MRKLMLVVFFAAVPALAFAKPNEGTGDLSGPRSNLLTPNNTMRLSPSPDPINSFGMGTLGGGMFNGNEPGHVFSPGGAPVDNDSRGPINDVQPGSPHSGDTRAATNPKPVY